MKYAAALLGLGSAFLLGVAPPQGTAGSSEPGAAAAASAPAASASPTATAASANAQSPAAPGAAPAKPSKLWVCRGNANAPSRDMYITVPFAVEDNLATWRKAQTALSQYMLANYKPTSMNCDSFATKAEADARVQWLVNWAHQYKFDPVSVKYTYKPS